MAAPQPLAVLARLRSHLFGNAVAYAALFVALGGTSYAAATLPKNSVGNAQIVNAAVGPAKLKVGAVTGVKLRNGAVTGAKLRNNAVTSAKVKDGSLLMRDFKPGELKVALKTVKGPAGAIGPTGAQGPQGPAGATSVQIRTVSGAAGADGRYTATAVCQSGERAVGGGAALLGPAHTNDHVIMSRPGVLTGSGGFGAGSNVPNAGDTPNSWTAEVYSATTGRTLNVFVVCAAP